jgi:hypothetical protein
LPGIPVIYYGTEQGFTEQRAAMFAAGWGSGGRDRFDTTAPLYRDIAAMTALRKRHRVFSRGVPTVLRSSAAGPGALAWRMQGDGRQALVVFNTAGHEILLDNLATGLVPGSRLRGLYGLGGQPADQVVGAGGLLSLRLPPHSGQVWALAPGPGRAGVAGGPAPAAIQLNALPSRTVSGDFVVTGRAQGVREFKLVVDGDLAGATTAVPDAQGAWQARVDTSAMVDTAVEHRLTAWAEGVPAALAQTFVVARPWQVVADVPDPAGDDHGPSGRYTYPTDPGWGDNRQMDLRRVRVATAGGALRLDLQTARVTTSWNPANGFDHVAFTVYIELPGQAGRGAVSCRCKGLTCPRACAGTGACECTAGPTRCSAPKAPVQTTKAARWLAAPRSAWKRPLTPSACCCPPPRWAICLRWPARAFMSRPGITTAAIALWRRRRLLMGWVVANRVSPR